MITYRQPFRGSYPITQRYGELIPGVTFQNKPHTGIDYGCPAGTPILASANGVCLWSGYDATGYGMCVIILHSVNRATLYAHLSECLIFVNQKVEQGEVIGKSGSTGNSTGPHLHFEARTKWNDASTHFNPFDLPMMSVDDSISTISHTEQQNDTPIETHSSVGGKCQVACEAAWVRDWQTMERSYLLSRGEKVYVFDDVKEYNGLPYRFIGGNRCMAEYDGYGTQILEADHENV